jgi:hypothetical protein
MSLYFSESNSPDDVTTNDTNAAYTAVVQEAIANVNKRDSRKAKVTAEIMKEAKEIVSKKLRKLSQERNAQGGFTKEYRVYNHLKNQVDSSYIEAINRIFADSSSTFPGSSPSHDDARRFSSRGGRNDD